MAPPAPWQQAQVGTFVLLPMILDGQVEQGEEVIVIQKHLVGRLLESNVDIWQGKSTSLSKCRGAANANPRAITRTRG